MKAINEFRITEVQVFAVFNMLSSGLWLADVPAVQAVHPMGRDPEEAGGGEGHSACGVATDKSLMMKERHRGGSFSSDQVSQI